MVLCICQSRALTPGVSLGDFVVQRAIQTQLHYSASLRNEPQVSWLAKFEDHEHLDSTGRHAGAAGFPGTYRMAFGQLKMPFEDYLTALGDAPDDVVEVELAAPPKRLSARQRANPYLAKQAQKSMFYDEPIFPRAILSRVLDTADALVETWGMHLGVLEEGDAMRVDLDRSPVKGLPDASMRAAEELAEGGETVYAHKLGEPMPLYAFDRRACDRAVTLRALEALGEEVRALTPSTAFETGYLHQSFLLRIRKAC